jgi:hypothetical protein
VANGVSWVESLGCTSGGDLGFCAWRALVCAVFVWERLEEGEWVGVDEPPAAGAKIFVISFVLSLIMALNLAMFLNDPKTNLTWGATAGFLAGFGWVAMGIGIVSLFERRPWTYVLVNGGYLTVALVVMGAILGGWR